MDLDTLNRRFALDSQLEFVTGKGGLVNAVIRNAQARAVVSLYGGQVLSWQPAGQQHDVLFLSEQAYYQPGKAIKGGVPVCWPWFGADPQGKGRPAHGFARNSLWDVLGTSTLADGAIQLVLGLALNEQTRALWDGDIAAQLEITVGSTLQLVLTTFNRGGQPIELTQALHTYFAVGDITQASVHGLDGRFYLDKAKNGKDQVQSGAVEISAEVDRIYTDVAGELAIHDRAWQRRIRIHSTGSHSAVVWNPWQAIAASMADLGDEDYRRLLCVETTNAGPDRVQLAAGGEYRLTAEYAVESL
jgi:glucose-6-phosphate 1-epimerase